MNSNPIVPITLNILINKTYTPPIAISNKYNKQDDFNKAISIGNYNGFAGAISYASPITYDRPLCYYKSR